MILVERLYLLSAPREVACASGIQQHPMIDAALLK